MECYAAYYDNGIRLQSSSGGVFSVIAGKFDIVYGVAMTEDFYECEFIRVEGDIAPLRGSKYFQAKVGETFKSVKRDLQEGKRVLFSGTGCQINGLYMFLGQEYDNLFLLDIICHGVPSPKLWREYLKYQESKVGRINSINFRDKSEGWSDFGMKENDTFISMHQDSFLQMFLRDYCLRPSCYNCHAKTYRKADITIADFWGIQKIEPELYDDKGTSLVIIRTEKGKALFETIKPALKCKEVKYRDGVKNNTSEYSSVNKPLQRDQFFKDLSIMPFDEMERKYAGPITVTFRDKIIQKADRVIKRIFSALRHLKAN